MSGGVQVFETISQDTRNRVLKFHGTNQERGENDVRVLLEWAKKQPHFPETPCADIIWRFLLINKFSIEKAKKKLDCYYTIRSKLPEIFSVSNPNRPEMMKYVDTNYFVVLPKTTPDLDRVSVFKLTSADPDLFDPHLFFAWSLDVAEIRLFEDFSKSDLVIVDLSNCGLGHLMKISPMMLKKAATCIEKVYTTRTQGLHFLNCPPIADRFLKALKAVVKPKIADRFFVHAELKSLYGSVPKEILPEDYGGAEKSLKELNDLMKLKMREYKERFDALDALKVDESLRPGACILDDDVFGAYGNFRKIDFD